MSESRRQRRAWRAGARKVAPGGRVLPVVLAAVLLAGCADLGSPVGHDDYVGPARRAVRVASSQAATSRAGTDGGALIPATGSIPLSPEVAILAAIQNNPALLAQAMNPAIERTFVEQQRALFDPTIVATAQAGRTRAPLIVADLNPATVADNVSVQVGVNEFLPTGTTIALTATSQYTDDLGSDLATNSRAGLSVTQSLLRGAGLDVNLASLRQARIDVLTSQYQLRGFAIALVEEVENTYWDYALASRRIAIVTQALDVAQRQLDETGEMVKVGKLAEVEMAAAQAEVALRREDLIDARATLDSTRLHLLRLVGPTRDDLWGRQVDLLAQPFDPGGKIDPVEAHVALAMRMRPDFNEAELQLQRDQLDIVKTRNGLLPELDLFMTLGKSGYANSFGRSVQDISGKAYDALVGLNLSLPVTNRDAEAADLRAHLTRGQQLASIDNLRRLAEVDVRSDYIEYARTREQIAATAATRKLQEVNLRNETEKFRVGKSTSLLVAQAERDLLSAQLGEVQAVVGHLEAAVTLFAADGSLLERRGIDAPGRLPPTEKAWRVEP